MKKTDVERTASPVASATADCSSAAPGILPQNPVEQPSPRSQLPRISSASALPFSPSSTWSLRTQGLSFIPSGPFCLEVCAGSGRLTAALRHFGLDAWGIDHKRSKLVPETAAMLTLDLTDKKDIATLWRLLAHPQLIFVHMAPPCGTCSRARDRALRGVPGGGPPPLRSPDFPEGFPDLADRLPDGHARVVAANAIYQLLVEIALYLLSRGIAWAMENPRKASCG